MADFAMYPAIARRNHRIFMRFESAPRFVRRRRRSDDAQPDSGEHRLGPRVDAQLFVNRANEAPYRVDRNPKNSADVFVDETARELLEHGPVDGR